MRKVIIAIAVCLLAVGVVTVVKSTDRGDHQHRITMENKQTTSKSTRQKESRPHVLSIDSLEKTDRLINKLNKNDAVGVVDHSVKTKSHYVDNEVTVKFKIHPNRAEMSEIERSIDGKLVKNMNTVCIFSSKSKSASDLVQYFSNDTNVDYVEPNYIYVPNNALERKDATFRKPNDVLYPDYQWNLPMIGTEIGWEITRGSERVTIAVVDTGVDLDHPDLSGRLVEGRNILADNDQPDDDNGHGTHVAGIIASQTNNREGIAGITWFNKIMPIKVMDKEGSGTSFDVANGIIWATDHGAEIINLSLGNYQPAAVIEEAIQHAFDNDVILVAATGNDSTDQPGYPAAYPQVISVAAVDQNGEWAEFSNFGDYVNVTAPGVAIASTYPGKAYAEMSGTSMAAPHVTALAALIRSSYPELSNTQVMHIINRTTTDLGEPGYDGYYGNGLIDVVQALQAAHKKRYPLGRMSEWWERIVS